MSFVYAEKYQEPDTNRESVRILCDTKVVLNNYSSTNLSKKECELVSKYGIVKSTICCPEVCISFAGNNIILATKLFNKLKDLKTFEPEDITDYAFQIHNDSGNPNDIEFIVTYISNGDIHIDCVKDGKVNKNVQFAHIGSDDAFKDFQRFRLSTDENVSTYSEQAFRDVVNGCSDDSVGGRVIGVTYSNNANSFVYRYEGALYSPKPHIVKQGGMVSFSTKTSEGGYSYQVEPQDMENVLFNINQIKPAILYSRRYRIDSTDADNPNLFGLMLPILVEVKDDGRIIRYK